MPALEGTCPCPFRHLTFSILSHKQSAHYVATVFPRRLAVTSTAADNSQKLLQELVVFLLRAARLLGLEGPALSHWRSAAARMFWSVAAAAGSACIPDDKASF